MCEDARSDEGPSWSRRRSSLASSVAAAALAAAAAAAAAADPSSTDSHSPLDDETDATYCTLSSPHAVACDFFAESCALALPLARDAELGSLALLCLSHQPTSMDQAAACAPPPYAAWAAPPPRAAKQSLSPVSAREVRPRRSTPALTIKLDEAMLVGAPPAFNSPSRSDEGDGGAAAHAAGASVAVFNGVCTTILSALTRLSSFDSLRGSRHQSQTLVATELPAVGDHLDAGAAT